MKYKALFLDVDGTTVIHGVDNLPSERVTQAVKRAMRSEERRVGKECRL